MDCASQRLTNSGRPDHKALSYVRFPSQPILGGGQGRHRGASVRSVCAPPVGQTRERVALPRGSHFR